MSEKMKNYKEYKIDLSMYKGKVREALSAAVQHHAFELGYEWNSAGKEAFWIKSPYLFFNEDGITHLRDEDVSYFESHSGVEISADAFLALTPGEPELKPFDKVLVRDFDSEEWIVDIYSYHDANLAYPFQCLKSFYHQCIPYEGNECLLGTMGEPE